MRISDSIFTDRIRTSMTSTNTRASRLEIELATGSRINAPSDDPLGTAAALQYRAAIAADGAHARTVESAKGRLAAADTALDQLTQLLQKARDLTVQAGSATQDQNSLNAIATQLNQLLQQAVQVGNSQLGGEYLFAGAKTTAAPFSATGVNPATVTYAGDDQPVGVDVGNGSSVRLDVPGDQTFMPTMQALIQIRDGLLAGNGAATVQSGLNSIDAALDGLTATRADVGGRVNRLDQTSSALAAESTNYQTLKSQVEDTDVADVTVQLQSARNVYDAALSVASRVMQTSLVNFLNPGTAG